MIVSKRVKDPWTGFDNPCATSWISKLQIGGILLANGSHLHSCGCKTIDHFLKLGALSGFGPLRKITLHCTQIGS